MIKLFLIARKYILAVFSSHKSKKGKISYVTYTQFNVFHLKVYNISIVLQLNKGFSRFRSSFYTYSSNQI
jgi:hypothetical protein